MTRTTITLRPGQYVTLGLPGERERLFLCRPEGGYVWELMPNGEHRQVCDRLHHRGPTLTCPSRYALLGVIRREHARYMQRRRAEQMRGEYR